jgi:hypothetical protein
MASKYYIGDAITKTAVHHKSYKDLWESKWKGPVRNTLPKDAPVLTVC